MNGDFAASTDPREALREIVDTALDAVDPKSVVAEHLALRNDALHVAGAAIPRSSVDRIFVAGAGKAGVPMARATERVLGDLIAAGIVVVPHGQTAPLEHIDVRGAGHPVPDAAGVAGGRAVLDMLAETTERDLLVCLISGGGSALLVCPAAGIDLDDLRRTNELLLACGASIVDVNALRKHLSAVKGGCLAGAAAPARVATLMLSDVVGDPIDAIASGPTAPDPTTFQDCLATVDRYRLAERLPAPVMQRLRAGAEGLVEETPKRDHPIFARVDNTVIGNNDAAVRAAAERAAELGFASVVLSTSIEGETREVAKVHAAIAREARATGRPRAAPCCLISGGETTVTLRGDGRGGRNQEFVLAAALELAGEPGITICSIGTDGIDGTTTAAGAIADGDSVARAAAAGIDARARLDDNDSHAVFAALGDLVVTGPTDTNVMDLRLLLIP